MVDGGAILRWPYDATAVCERCLHGLQAREEAAVLAKQVEEEPPLGAQETQ